MSSPCWTTFRKGNIFENEPIHQLKQKKRTEIFHQNIGFIFQAYHLLDDLTVYENIETPLLYKKVKSAERKALVADMLDRFNIVGKKIFSHTSLVAGSNNW